MYIPIPKNTRNEISVGEETMLARRTVTQHCTPAKSGMD